MVETLRMMRLTCQDCGLVHSFLVEDTQKNFWELVQFVREKLKWYVATEFQSIDQKMVLDCRCPGCGHPGKCE